jgi:hypothetical protein
MRKKGQAIPSDASTYWRNAAIFLRDKLLAR